MLYLPQIDDYLKISTDEEIKDSLAISCGEHFESIREEQNLRKISKFLYIFLTTPDEVQEYVQSNSVDNCIHRYEVEILNIRNA